MTPVVGMVGVRTQNVSDVLDYGFSYVQGPDGPWLDVGDSIATSAWSFTDLSGQATTITLQTPTFDTETTTVWITGGTSGVTYLIENTITTTNNPSRQVSRFFQLTVF
jgi:hypothetical protein